MKKNIASRMKSVRRHQLAAGALAVILAMFPWVSEKPALGQTVSLTRGANPAELFDDLEALRISPTPFDAGMNLIELLDGFTTDGTLTGAITLNDSSAAIRKAGTNNTAYHIDGNRGAFSFISGSSSGTAELNLDSINIENFGGGAVSTYGAVLTYAYDITGTQVTFSGNRNTNITSSGGGAVYIEQGTLTLSEGTRNSSFINNESSKAGGAVSAKDARLNITGTDFRGNKAVAAGGAVNLFGNLYTGSSIANSSFDGNKANDGGAVALVGRGIGSANSAGEKVEFTNIKFTNNEAKYYGGAVLVQDAQAVITNTVFGTGANDGNRAYQGGAVFFEGTDNYNEHTLEKVTFQGNKAVGGGGAFGGAVAVTGGDSLKILGSEFIGNSADANGGAVAVVNGGSLDVSRSGQIQTVFQDNVALGDGGAVSITLDGSAVNDTAVTFTDTVFTGNTANERGGAVAAVNDSGRNANVNIVASQKDVIFEDNYDSNGANDLYLRKTDLMLNAANGKFIEINGGIDSDAKVTKTGAGTVNINAESKAGVFAVDAGKLAIYAHSTADSVTVGTKTDKGNLTIGGTSDPAAGESGTGMTLTVKGTTTLGNNGTLFVGLYDEYEAKNGAVGGAAVVTNGFVAQVGSVIDINSFGKYDWVDVYDPAVPIYTLVKSDSEIDKNGTYQFTIGGLDASGDTFLNIGEYITEDNKNLVQVGAGLRWYNKDNGSANGTFCVDQGKVFTLSAGLGDNIDTDSWKGDAPMNNYTKWDGKSLWKDCSGTLVLSGNSTYTGGTHVIKGTLVAASVDGNGNIASVGVNPGGAGYNPAESFIEIKNDAVFEVGRYGIDSSAESIVGTLAKEVKSEAKGHFVINAGPSGTITVERANTGLLGSVEIATGTGRITNLDAFGNNTANRTVKVDNDAKFEIAVGGEFKQGITGGGSLVKSSADDLTINHANNYTGGTKITQGTLIAGNNDGLGTGNVDLSGGNLKLIDGGTESSIPVFGNSITGAGNVNIELAKESDWISLGGKDGDYTGTTNIVRGNLELTNVNATGKNGAVDIQDADSVLRFNIEKDAAETYTNKITGSGNVEKIGGGRIALNQVNDYTGTTTVNEGTLAAGNRDATGTGTVIQVDKSGTFEVAYGGDFTKTVQGTGNFAVNSGNGKRSVIQSENTYTGDTVLKSGTAVINTVTALGQNTSDRTVHFDGGSLELALGAGNQTFSQSLSGDTGSVVKVNTGKVILDGSSEHFKGDVSVKDGELVAHHVSNTRTIDALGVGNVSIEKKGKVTLDLAGELKTAVSGSGTLTVNVGKGKTATLSGDNGEFSGLADVQSGIAKITNLNGAGTNDYDTGSVELSKDGSLEIASLENGSFHKKINGIGSVIKSGASTVALEHANAYEGGTLIKGGILVVKNEDALGTAGEVTVQSPGTLEVGIAADFDPLIQGDGNVNINPGDGEKVIFSKENTYSGLTSVESGSLVLENLKGTGSTKRVNLSDGTALELEVSGKYDRTVAGEGQLIIGDGKQIELTGTNSHLNTVVEEDARLDIGSDSALGREETVLKDGASLGFTQSVSVNNGLILDGHGKVNIDTRTFNSEIKGSISGTTAQTSGIVKTGTGSLTLTGNNTFTGGLDINTGRIIVDKQDALGAGYVKTTAAGELELNIKGRETLRSGIDTSAGKLVKSGIGQLDFTEKYTTGKLEVVDGSIGVLLGKGSVKATNGFTAGSDAKVVGMYENAAGLGRGEDKAQKFLALDGAGSGSFSKYDFISDLSHVRWTTAQEGKQLYYLLWLDSFAGSYGDRLSPNAKEAAKGADQLPLTDDLLQVLNGLTNGNDVVKAFNELHGEIYATTMYSVADLQRGFNERVLDRRLLCEHCRDFKTFRGQDSNTNGVPRELWATFTGGGNFRGQQNRFSGYSIGRWGVMGGLEQQYARGLFTGVALGYDQADLKLRQLPMNDQFYAFRAAGYVSYTIEDWSVLAFTGYSKNWHEVKRNISLVDTVAKNRYDDDVFTMGFEAGKLYHWNGINLQPVFGVDYVHVAAPQTVEKNGGVANLAVTKNRYTSFRVPLGVKSSSEFDIQGVKFRPEVRGYFIPDFGNSGIYGRTAFASAPSNAFIVNSGIRTHGGIRFGFGTQARLTDFLNVGVDYDMEVWSGYTRHDVGGNIALRW